MHSYIKYILFSSLYCEHEFKLYRFKKLGGKIGVNNASNGNMLVNTRLFTLFAMRTIEEKKSKKVQWLRIINDIYK